MKNKINIYLDYRIEDLSNYHGNSFPPLIYKYLSKFDKFKLFSLSDKITEKLDCIIIINGGSHWTYRDFKLNNFHFNQFIKWSYPKIKKFYYIISLILGLDNTSFYRRHMFSNKSYEKHLRNLIKKNPEAKIIHRLDGIYQVIGKVYGYDKTIAKINNLAHLTIYQNSYSKATWENGAKTIFGKSQKLKPKLSKIINNGIDLSIFNQFGDAYDFKIKYPILNVSASPAPKKGLYKILELANCLKNNSDFHIYLIGKQINDPYCGSYIKNFENITYLGPVNNRNELSKYYKGAKVFLFPSEDDCSPNVILEAMACGLPILTVNSGGIPELIEKESFKAGLYIDEENPMMSLSTIVKFYDNFSKNAVYLAENYFDFNETAKKYIQEIEKLVD